MGASIISKTLHLQKFNQNSLLLADISNNRVSDLLFQLYLRAYYEMLIVAECITLPVSLCASAGTASSKCSAAGSRRPLLVQLPTGAFAVKKLNANLRRFCVSG